MRWAGYSRPRYSCSPIPLLVAPTPASRLSAITSTPLPNHGWSPAKWTMFYMAVSLRFTAGGIILLYLLWNVQPVEGQTLNAVTFRAIIESAGWRAPLLENGLLWIVLALEGGLLFVAANTGFLGGPAVLANMAADSWVPHMYRYLSTRLVTQYGILLMGDRKRVV